jgi:hypothetical protein
MIRRDHTHGSHQPAIYKSLGLNVLVNLMSVSWKPEVLDLGPALGANVDFWSGYPCRLHIRDLYRAFAEQDVSDQPQIPAEPTLFRIIDSEQISYESRTAKMKSCPRHQPRDLSRLISGFDISHSFLLRNGIQEFLFTRG